MKKVWEILKVILAAVASRWLEKVARDVEIDESKSTKGAKIEDAELWFTYAYSIRPLVDSLEDTAERIIDSGLATLATLPEGKVLWAGESGVESATLNEKPNNPLSQWIQFKKPENFPPELASLLLVNEAFRAGEWNLFSELSAYSSHVRLLLPLIEVELENGSAQLFPILQVFSDGVVLLSFNLDLGGFSSGGPVSVFEFTDELVNLPTKRILSVLCDEAFAKLQYVYLLSGCSFLGRLKLSRSRSSIVGKLPKEMREGPFGNSAFRRIDTSKENLHLAKIGHEYVGSLAYVLGSPREGMSYLLLGDRSPFKVTERWSGHVSVYLWKFSGQQPTASDNERLHAADFARIVMRSPHSSATLELPRNLRLLDDFGIYVGEAASLFAFTTSMVTMSAENNERSSRFEMPVAQQQVKVEAVEHALAALRGVGDILSEKRDVGTKELLRVEEYRHDFDRQLSEMHRFGEVREHFEEALRARKIDERYAEIESLLALRVRQASLKANNRINAVVVLAAVFGILISGANLITPLDSSLPDVPGAMHWLLAFAVPAGLILIIALVSWLAGLRASSR